MKAEIVNKLDESLSGLGLPLIRGVEADLAVDVELLDAHSKSGSKSLNYENSILVSDEDKTVYLYEKTIEKSKGFSFGSSNETSFQSGKSLMRRVSGTFIGADGTQVSYDFELGQISKTIKAVAEEAGYKFKVVLRRKSASY